MIEIVQLKRTSLCPCGYPTVHEGIQTGTNYRINRDLMFGGYFYKCGRCNNVRYVTVVAASSVMNPEAELAPFPADLFDGVGLPCSDEACEKFAGHLPPHRGGCFEWS